jgi:hypothetical protein
MYAPDVEAVRAALSARVIDVVTELLGEPNPKLSSKSELRFGRKGSLVVKIAGAKVGAWFDHENGVGGDLLSLIRQRLGGTFQDAIEYSRQIIGCLPTTEPPMPFRGGKSGADDVECNARRAAELWQEARPIAETIVPHYFAKRGLTRLPADMDETALRYHPCCPFSSARLPCLLALMRDVRTNEPRAIQRTAIDKAGDKIGRMCLGPKAGTAIKLSANEHVTMGLAIGEGLETVLSGMRLGFRPAWALGDAANVRTLPVLSGIECLTILVDNDESGTGQRAALECSRRWTYAGREVFRLIPNQGGEDFNDIVGRRSP